MLKEAIIQEFIDFNTVIYETISLKKSPISNEISSKTLLHCGKVSGFVKFHYSGKKKILFKKILVLMLLLETFPNSWLISNKKHHLMM
jgi:hypothetical protein